MAEIATREGNSVTNHGVHVHFQVHRACPSRCRTGAYSTHRTIYITYAYDAASELSGIVESVRRRRMQYSHAAQDKFRQAKIIQDQDTQGTQGTQNMQDTQQAGHKSWPRGASAKRSSMCPFYVQYLFNMFSIFVCSLWQELGFMGMLSNFPCRFEEFYSARRSCKQMGKHYAEKGATDGSDDDDGDDCSDDDCGGGGGGCCTYQKSFRHAVKHAHRQRHRHANSRGQT